MNFKIHIITLIFLLIAGISVQAQENCLFLSTDHDVYFPGQDILCKIWDLSGSNLNIKVGEDFFFIELYSDDQEIIEKKIIPVGSGGSSAVFEVPQALPSGFYILRAYTNSLKESGPSRFAYREVMVINPAIDNRFPFPENKMISGKTVRAEFYPEGGKIIRGIQNRVYVEFENIPDNALDGSFVINSPGDTVSILSVIDRNTAFFDFVPYTSDYQIRIPAVFPHRPIYLPVSELIGYKLKFIDNINRINFILESNDLSLSFTNLRIKVKNYEKTGEDNERIIKVEPDMSIDRNNLDYGLNHFILLNSRDSILAQNFFLKEDERSIRISINESGGIPVLSPREQIRVEVNASDNTGRPVNAVLNILVREKEPSLNGGSGLQDFFKYRKYIFLKPEWNPDSPEFSRAVSAIYGPLLFDSIEYKANKTEKNITHQSFSLKGKLIDGNMAGHNIFLSIPGDSSQIFVTHSDQNGDFEFPGLNFHGEKEIFLKTEDSLQSGYISVKDYFYPDYLPLNQFQSELDSSEISFLDKKYQEWLIDRVYGLEYNTDVEEKWQSNQVFYDRADFYLSMDNYVEFPNMEEVFFEIVKPVMILRDNKDPYLKVIGRVTNRTIGDRPLYVIDGIPFTEPVFSFGLNPLNVRDISVIARKYFIGSEVYDGIIIINTRSNNLSYIDPNMVFLRQDYIFPEREVSHEFSPLPVSEFKPYNPSTIFWNSSLETGSQGKANFGFQAPDMPGTYELIIEGMDLSTSVPGMRIIEFKVE